jgi:hypothetical protein
MHIAGADDVGRDVCAQVGTANSNGTVARHDGLCGTVQHGMKWHGFYSRKNSFLQHPARQLPSVQPLCRDYATTPIEWAAALKLCSGVGTEKQTTSQGMQSIPCNHVVLASGGQSGGGCAVERRVQSTD